MQDVVQFRVPTGTPRKVIPTVNGDTLMDIITAFEAIREYEPSEGTAASSRLTSPSAIWMPTSWAAPVDSGRVQVGPGYSAATVAKSDVGRSKQRSRWEPNS